MREQEYRAALSVASLVATSSSALAQLALQSFIVYLPHEKDPLF